MKHQVFGRNLHRTKKERLSLFRLLAEEFVLNGKLTTTKAKAKAVQPLVEHFVTKAKKPSEHVFRYLCAKLGNKKTAQKMLKYGVLFAGTNGGYTKILKLGARPGDNSSQVVMFWSKPLSENEKQTESTQTESVEESKKSKETKSKQKTKQK
jgi:large subunit ribosomal protein L17